MNLSETKFRALVRALLKENESYKNKATSYLGTEISDAVKGSTSVFTLEDNALRTRLVHKSDPSIKLVPKSNDKSTQTFKEYILNGKGSVIDFVRSIDMTKLGKATNVQKPREKMITILKYINNASLPKDTASTVKNVEDVESKQSANANQQQQQQQQDKGKEQEFKKDAGENIDVNGLSVIQAINAYLEDKGNNFLKDLNNNYLNKWTKETEENWDMFIAVDFRRYLLHILNELKKLDAPGDIINNYQNLYEAGYKEFQNDYNTAIKKYDYLNISEPGPTGALRFIAKIHHHPNVVPDSIYNLIEGNPDPGSSNINITANMSLVEKAEEYARYIKLPPRIVYGILSVESGGNPRATAFNSDNFVKLLSEESGSSGDKKASYDTYKDFVAEQQGNKGTGGEIDKDGNFKFIEDVAYYSSHSNSLSKRIQDKALELNFTAAFRAIAWGAFQIMGFHAVKPGEDVKAKELYKQYNDNPQEFSNDMLIKYLKNTPKIIDQYTKANNSGNIKDYLVAANTYYGKADQSYAEGIKRNAEAYDKIKGQAN